MDPAVKRDVANLEGPSNQWLDNSRAQVVNDSCAPQDP